MRKEIVVNVDHDETRVAVLEEGVLVELYIERTSNQRVVGAIYKGRVDNVLPGMEAAFVDVGLDRNAFLYVADAIPAREGDEDEAEVEAPRGASIKDLLKVGQELVLQVTKEPIGTKGARVSSHITLPGRYLVLMPTVDYIGISRRIGDEGERSRLRALAEKIKPAGMGLIVRTVAEGHEEQDLAADVKFLVRLWNKILSRARTTNAPALLHRDLGLVFRVVRDVLGPDTERLVVDSRHEQERILDLLDDISPDLKDRVTLFDSHDRSVFELYGIETEIEKALRKRVWLRSGGYLVIDQAEALTVIDVNTGKYVGSTNLADTVLRTNLEAAREIARQLRLRDIGGIIIVDFIDMEVADHRQKVLAALNEALKDDRTKTNVLGITQLGLVEMTRKKVTYGLDDVLQKLCPYCEGKGKILSEETMAAKVRREIREILRHTDNEAILVEVHPSVAALIIGAGGVNLKELEKNTGKSVYVKGSAECHPEEMKIRGLGTREEVETKALPVRQGQTVEVKIEEPHVSNLWDGIARMDGYVIDVEGAGKRVGEKVKVEITKVYRTYAKARVV